MGYPSIYFYKLERLKKFDLESLVSLTQLIQLLVWSPNFIKAYIVLTLWVNPCLQFDSK